MTSESYKKDLISFENCTAVFNTIVNNVTFMNRFKSEIVTVR